MVFSQNKSQLLQKSDQKKIQYKLDNNKKVEKNQVLIL